VSVTRLNPYTLGAIADQCEELSEYIGAWRQETPWMQNLPIGVRLFEVQQAATLFARVLDDLADEIGRVNAASERPRPFDRTRHPPPDPMASILTQP
jgi:hypothetical protein